MQKPKNIAYVPLENILHEVFESIENRGQRGLETGFFELDDMLNGLQNGDLVVLGSRPAVGKSSFALNIIEAVSADSKTPSALLTMEQSAQQVAQRLICSRAEIDGHKLRKGMLQSQEYAKLAHVVGELTKAPLFVDAISRPSLDLVREWGERAVEQKGCRLLVIDYLQMIWAPADNRAEQLTLVSQVLKELALDLDVPVVALSQLNRHSLDTESYRPTLRDLRGSGTLEDEADVVLLIHRDDYYRLQEPDFVPDNIAEVIIAKQRNGPTGTVKLTFDGRSTRFRNLTTLDPF